MRTTLTVDDDVYDAARQISQSSGERLGKIVSRLARRGLEAPAQVRQSKSRRFPVFDVAPGTPKMSLDRIDQFIEEEGLF
jgi:hypothetical protein